MKLSVKSYRDREEKAKYRDMKHQKQYEKKSFMGRRTIEKTSKKERKKGEAL